jgi:PKD repeat protein
MWGELRGKYGYNSRIYGKWTGPTNLNKGYASRDFFDIKADDSDMLHAVFRGDAANLYYSAKSANDLGDWPTEEKIVEGRACSHAAITCCSKGYAHVSYGDIPVGASHSRDIWYATFKRAVDSYDNYPKADFTMSSGSETVIEGSSVTFDASPSKSEGGEISSYHWDFGDFYDDENYSEKKAVSHTFPKEGEYKVTLSVVDNIRNLIGNKSVTVKVISSPMPPLNAVVETYLYRGFLYRDWINKIEWQANPQNTELGFTIEAYRIYKRLKGSDSEWTPLTDVSTTTYFNHRGFTTQQDALNVEYGVSVVAAGLESEITPAIPGS